MDTNTSEKPFKKFLIMRLRLRLFFLPERMREDLPIFRMPLSGLRRLILILSNTDLFTEITRIYRLIKSFWLLIFIRNC